jgi:hypothetical protein
MASEARFSRNIGAMDGYVPIVDATEQCIPAFRVERRHLEDSIGNSEDQAAVNRTVTGRKGSLWSRVWLRKDLRLHRVLGNAFQPLYQPVSGFRDGILPFTNDPVGDLAFQSSERIVIRRVL